MARRSLLADTATPLLGLVLAGCGSSVTTQPDDGEPSAGGASPSTSVVVASSSGGVGGQGQGGGSGGDGGGTSSTSSGPEPVPPFRTPVDMADDALALRALQLVGADVEGAEDGCVPCHALTEGNLGAWTTMTNESLDECLTDLDVTTQESAAAMIACVRARSGIPGSKFAAHALGFWTAGARRDWWSYTFRKAYPQGWQAQWDSFVEQVQMPADGSERLTEGEYDLVAEWFVRGAPLLDELLDEEPPPGDCDVHVDPAVAAHVEAMQTTGWRAVNAGAGMLMFGCAGAEGPQDCLAATPNADPAWEVEGQGVLRSLATTSYESSYWTRTSANGRWVGHGTWSGSTNAAMIDLQAEVTIPVEASYDPAFFPDDSGFVFQGGNRNVCSTSVLAGPPALVTMNEAGCSQLTEVGLYQHVGATLGGGDYFAVSGPFVSDDGGHSTTLQNPAAWFGGNSGAYLVPMVFDGSSFDAKAAIGVSTPGQGDAVISHSARLLISRVDGPGGAQNGLSLRRVDATPDGAGSYDVEVPEVARYCIDGGKPAFSFDERWIVLHSYVEDTDEDAQALGFTGRTDPGFAGYRSEGASNIWLVELATNTTRRITTMRAGEYALFPSFRSDGWIYFVVRKPGTGKETLVASDAALVAEDL